MNDQPITPLEKEWLSQAEQKNISDSKVRDNPDIAQQIQLNQWLTEHIGKPVELPYADFFNDRLKRTLQQEMDSSPENAIEPWIFRLWKTFKKHYQIISASTIVLMIGGWFVIDMSSKSNMSFVTHVFTPNPQFKTQISYFKETGVTVVDITGLNPLPKEKNVVGYQAVSSTWDMASLSINNIENEVIAKVKSGGQIQFLK
jgi:hypothetical protein